VGFVGTALLLVGCGAEADPPSGQESSVSQPRSSSTPPAGGLVEQAKSDLAGRLGQPAAEITLVSAEEVTWRDAALGCPQPGMYYAQVLTNGSRIVLTAGGKQYHYHSGGQRAPFLCENPQPPLPTN
jgi:hypothetical protein